MFIRWECGCIGIDPSAQPEKQDRRKFNGNGIILVTCDEDRDAVPDTLSWGFRDMSGKAVSALDWEEEQQLHRRIARRFAKAARFDHIRMALGVKDE